MNAARPNVPVETLIQQARAADPLKSVWVSANAGSGKTHVLSSRVIRLLLNGSDPSRILCLTYTRAAAANMSRRIFEKLSAWAVMPEYELADTLAELEGSRPDREKLGLARRLFARALETPGGLKIQTIHAFCEAVLHQFPLEANIAGHFELLDQQQEAALMAEARSDLLANTIGAEDSDLSAAFNAVLAVAGEFGLDQLLSEAISARNTLRPLLETFSAPGTLRAALRAAVGLGVDDSESTIADGIWPDPYFDRQIAESIEKHALAARNSAAAKFGVDLAEAIVVGDPVARMKALCALFLNEKNGKRECRSTKNIATIAVRRHLPDLKAEFVRFADKLLKARDRVVTMEMIDATVAALVVAEWLISRYERLKSARGYLDFDDLIARTVNLLSRPDAGPWVQYKLDRGLDHILIDEAQDTSPGQWQVIRYLVEELFSGEGTRESAGRTVFAVGDEKQSIYSFQGAEPAAFAETGHEFARRMSAARLEFRRVRLQHSFRSVGDVLEAVDHVFREAAARKGLTLDPEEIDHPPVRIDDLGYVEIWPMIAAQTTDEPEDWTQAIDHASAPAVRLADTVAGAIERAVKRGEVIDGKCGPIDPGDIMVLVRKRDSFVHALSRSLKNRHIAVAGADRLQLRDHIAVKDLMAIGRFVLQPDDDLSLAAVLRSPIFRLTDRQLFDLAHDRGAVSLWQSLRRAAAHDPAARAMADMLSRWRSEAGFKSFFDFYACLLGRDRVRAALIARLGAETGEILDEFINFALAMERDGVNGLGSFLQTLEHASPEIKREIDQTRKEVRIMTVHAAKGLEAPVVYLVDNGSDPSSHAHLPRLLPFTLMRGNSEQRAFLWRANSSLKNEFSAQQESLLLEKAEDEYRRLLYVGMTRAEDRLIVCGYHGVRGPKDTVWHRLVTNALGIRGKKVPPPQGIEGEAIRFTRSDEGVGKTDVAPRSEREKPVKFPEELAKPLPPDETLPRPLTPSRTAVFIDTASETTGSGGSPVLADQQQPSLAIERGRIIHHLLQYLPELNDERRESAAKSYLERKGAGWTDPERLEAWQAVAKILSDNRFSAVFAENSRPEVTIAGRLDLAGKERAVSGTIDRLAVGENEVLFVDYKTNRLPPASLDEIPPAYVSQVALYAALLAKIYPGRVIRAWLLFTSVPRMFEIPDTVMQAALERLAGT